MLAICLMGVWPPLQAATGPRAGARELVFIDTAVQDCAALAGAVRPGAETVLLDPARDEWAQIADALRVRRSLSAVHLFSHGAPGLIQLGRQRIGAAALGTADLGTWRRALAPDGEILLYGCEVGRGDAGRAFLEALATQTGLAVAASSRPVGDSAQGGAWSLDRRVGQVRTPALHADAFAGLLSLRTPSNTMIVLNNDTAGDYCDNVVGLPNNTIGVSTFNGNTGNEILKIYDGTGTLTKTIEVDALFCGSGLPYDNSASTMQYLQYTYAALSNGNLVIVCNANDSSLYSVKASYMNAYFCVINQSGVKQVPDTQINTVTGNSQTRFFSVVVLSNGNVAFGYQLSTNTDLATRVFNPATGAAVSSEYVVCGNTYTQTGVRAYQPDWPSMAPNNATGGYIFAWGANDYVGSGGDVASYMLFQADGTPTSATPYTIMSNSSTSALTDPIVIGIANNEVLMGCGLYSPGITSYVILADSALTSAGAYSGATSRSLPANGYFSSSSVVPIYTSGNQGYVILSTAYAAPSSPASGSSYTGNDYAYATRYDTAGNLVENYVQLGSLNAYGSNWSSDDWQYDGNCTGNSFFIGSGYSQGLVLVESYVPETYDSSTDGYSSSSLTLTAVTFEMASAAAAPTATTGSATSIGMTGATLNGTVNDNGAATTVTFDYGITTSYGSTASGGTVSAGSGSTPVSAAITGLGCNTIYHYRVEGQNGTGTTDGTDATFTTGACLPVISGVSLASGPASGGATVLITGVNFTGATAVKFGTTAAISFTVNSDTQITATAPAELAGTVDIVVTTEIGSSSTSSVDDYTYIAAPAVTSLSPSSGPTSAGTAVTITGTNLTGATAVKFGASAASYTVTSASQIRATAPAATAGTVDVTVVTAGGTSSTSAADQFTFVAAPTVTGISPSTGPAAGGTAVTVTGTNLTAATAVQFGSQSAASYTVNSAAQIVATAPAGTAGAVDITITTAGGTSATSSADQFTFVLLPAVTAVSPSGGHAAGGTAVTISGTNFTGATAVKFGANDATSVTVVSGSQITAVSPAGTAGVVDVTVTTGVGTSATGASDQFTYWAVPGAPTIGTASAGDGRAAVAFTAPSSNGGTAITQYTVTSSGNQSATGTASPITVTGLTDGTAYTFTVKATNLEGTGNASAASSQVIPSPGGTLFIVHDGSNPLDPDLLAQLTAMAANGSNLTVTPGTAVPVTPASYDQIWDLRYGDGTPLSASDLTAYLAYLQQGGLLYLAGSNNSTGARDVSLAQMVSNAGGGTLALAAANATQTVQAPLTGPIVLSSLTYAGASGSSVLGNGASLSTDGTYSTAMAWAPGTLSLAPCGALVADFDIDYMTAEATANSQDFLANMLNYLTRISKMSPTVTGVTGPAAGAYKAGKSLAFTVTFDRAVLVTGTPGLPLDIGTQTASAAYASGSGSTALTFNYTVQSGDNGTLALLPALTLTGHCGTLSDASGFPARVQLNSISLASITIETATPATPAITSITGNSVVGTAEAGSTETISLDGTSYQVTADASGNWSWTIPASTSGTLTVTSTDAAGNASSVSAGVSVDTCAPVANTVNASIGFNSSATTIPLSITTATATSVAVASAATHGTATASGTSIAYTPNTDYHGTDAFTYTASNGFGTSAAATVSLTISADPSTAPTITLATLSNGAVVSSPLLNVSGLVSATNGLQQVALDGLSIPFLSDGRFSYPVRLKTGSNPTTLVATDQAGLTANLTCTVVLDTSTPALELSEPSDGAVLTSASQPVAGAVSFLPTSTDSLAQVTYTVNGGTALQATLLGNAFSFTANLAAGLNTIEVTATTSADVSVMAKRTVTLGSGLSLAVTDPNQDLLVTAGSYLLKGSVTGGTAPISVSVTVGGQSYMPPVIGGAFQFGLTLDSIQAWPVEIIATDASSLSASVFRTLVKASSTDPAAFTMADAYRALQIANGLVTPTAEDLALYDLAPRSNGVSVGDGAITVEDALLILWLASGQSL